MKKQGHYRGFMWFEKTWKHPRQESNQSLLYSYPSLDLGSQVKLYL